MLTSLASHFLRKHFAWLFILFTLAACASPAPTPRPPATSQPSPTSALATATPNLFVNDFTPPTGYAVGSPPESPGEFRLLTALSTDGRAFMPTGYIVSDQANVPDLISDAHGQIYLYYTGWQMGDKKNTIAVALSNDAGETWVHKHISFTGPRANAPAGDPDIVLLPDGTFRLFFTSGDAQTIKIWYADSADGLHFGDIHEAWARADAATLDSTTFWLNGVWHMLVLDPQRPIQWYATSPDATQFTLVNQPPILAEGEEYLLSNGYPVPEGYRMIGFSVPQKNFRTFLTRDGAQWAVEPGLALAHDPASAVEFSYIKDAAVLPLADGRYLMVYVTKLPAP